MTLEQVMALDGRALDGRALDAAVAGRIEWIGEPWKFSPIDGMPFDHPFPAPAPEFHKSWSAAMQIRDWARGLGGKQMYVWAMAVTECLDARLANTQSRSQYLDVLLWAIPADYARAALLVEE